MKDLNEQEWMTVTDTAKYLGLTRHTVYNYMRRLKDFPRPFRLGNRTVLFEKREVEKYLHSLRAVSAAES